MVQGEDRGLPKELCHTFEITSKPTSDAKQMIFRWSVEPLKIPQKNRFSVGGNVDSSVKYFSSA